MARSDPFLEALETVPLFSACSKREIQAIAKKAEHLTVEPGTPLVTEGAAGTEFFVIVAGQARVERHGRQVAALGPGGFFGDLALLDPAPRNATVIVETPMELAKLSQRGFAELLELPGFSKKLLAGLARRLRIADARSVG